MATAADPRAERAAPARARPGRPRRRRGLRPAGFVRALRRAAPLATAGIDPEGVHALRVCAARLETWLWLARVRVLRDDLRWLRRELRRARDLDVLPARIELAAAREWLAAERERAYAAARVALAGARFAGLVRALGSLSVAVTDARSRRVPALAERVLEAGTSWTAEPDDAEHVHALRKELRRLRYALEWLGRDAAEIERLQGQLGDACELAAARQLLVECRAAAPTPLLSLPPHPIGDGDPAPEGPDPFALEDARLAAAATAARALAMEAWGALARRLVDKAHAWS